MLRNLGLFSFLALSIMLSPHSAKAMGEGVLAQTGQYTFFIKPQPGSHMSYYQKLVPCVAAETVSIPRPAVQRYPLPYPVKRYLPVIISEKPVGCAAKAGSCIECYPLESSRSERKEIWPPNIKPVRIRTPEFYPREVTRRILLPQWFSVTEYPLPPRPPAKIRTDG